MRAKYPNGYGSSSYAYLYVDYFQTIRSKLQGPEFTYHKSTTCLAKFHSLENNKSFL